jgi:phosphoglycerol geranylgeranyltransferase
MSVPKLGPVESYLIEQIKEKGCILYLLVDPDEMEKLNISPKKCGEVAREAANADTTGFLVGGTLGVREGSLRAYILGIKAYVEKPTLIFPSGHQSIVKEADAILYMSLLNSTDPYWIKDAQILAAPLVKKFNLEPIPLAYLVYEPGGKVGHVGKAMLIPRDAHGRALSIAYGLAAQYLGFRHIYLEAGSRSPPIPNEIIKYVKKNVDILVGTGGGIRTREQAMEKAESGADYIFIGTAFEEKIYEYDKGRVGKKELREYFEELVEGLIEGAKKRKI